MTSGETKAQRARPVVIFGAGNQGGLLHDCLEGDERWRPVAFVDEGKAGQTLHGLPILGLDQFDPAMTRDAFMAIGFPAERRRFVAGVESLKLNWQTFIDRRSMVSPRARLGHGCLVLSFAMVSSNVTIGSFCYVSSYSRVGAGSVVGDFTSLMAGSAAGHCVIGNDCIMGVNSSCTEGADLGDDVTVAPYTWVKRKVPSGSLVTGSPARVFRKPSAQTLPTEAEAKGA